MFPGTFNMNVSRSLHAVERATYANSAGVKGRSEATAVVAEKRYTAFHWSITTRTGVVCGP